MSEVHIGGRKMSTLTMFLGLVIVVAVVIFALIRMDRESREALHRYCKNCGDNLTQQNFCSHCGVKSVLKPRCGCGKYYNPFREGGNYCSSCGKQLPVERDEESKPSERRSISGR